MVIKIDYQRPSDSRTADHRPQEGCEDRRGPGTVVAARPPVANRHKWDNSATCRRSETTVGVGEGAQGVLPTE